MAEKMITTEGWAIKYRPKVLDDMVGQDAVVNVVKGFIKEKRVPPVLLITGSTGSGKTTLATIIAAQLNGHKEAQENDPDLFEVDVADKKGIDDIRAVIQHSKFMPVRNFRIILLDEVHALGAQQASPLLKPLEKPNSHTVWILCTDQSEKLLKTIVGRSRVLKLNAPEPAHLIPLFNRILKTEKISFGSKQDKILERISETFHGQPRASLQLLQTVADIIAAGGKPSEALKQALSTSDGYAVEKVVVKTLISTYLGRVDKVISALGDTKEYGAVINYLLELNRYLLDVVGGAQTYRSPARMDLERVLKQNNDGKLPPTARIVKVHAKLTEMRQRATLYLIKEEHMLLSELSLLALSFAKRAKG